MADTVIKSVFEIEWDEATEARFDAQAEADYKAARVVSHEHVMEWLGKQAKGERVPWPRCRDVRAVRAALLRLSDGYAAMAVYDLPDLMAA